MATDFPPDYKKARNPETYLRHRREVLWQITLPLGIALVIVVGLAAFIAFGVGMGDQSQLADIALIQLIIPVMFFSLISLALLGASVYGLFRLLGILPYYFLRAQIFFMRVQLFVMRGSDKVVEPVLRAHAISARGQAYRRSLQRVLGLR
jgi:hypothetical protein